MSVWAKNELWEAPIDRREDISIIILYQTICTMVHFQGHILALGHELSGLVTRKSVPWYIWGSLLMDSQYYRKTLFISSTNAQKIHIGGTCNPAQVGTFSTVKNYGYLVNFNIFTILYGMLHFSARSHAVFGACWGLKALNDAFPHAPYTFTLCLHVVPSPYSISLSLATSITLQLVFLHLQ